jgi:hypothetical protein
VGEKASGDKGGKLRVRSFGHHQARNPHGHRHGHFHGHRHGHGHFHAHGHGRRDLAPSGVPGFVEVGSQVSHSSLAKSIAGLVFSADGSSNATSFDLGTSPSHSTQFFLVPAPDANSSSDAANANLNVVRLQIPVLNSQTLDSNDYCATFDLTPPSPLTLQKCGPSTGFSQSEHFMPSSHLQRGTCPDLLFVFRLRVQLDHR